MWSNKCVIISRLTDFFIRAVELVADNGTIKRFTRVLHNQLDLQRIHAKVD